ncbi:MAG: hypothetical protein NWF00_12315 [Candidatus Bathyarchaeota archaeon]|nr:hypothetical protein [Candidatus Bathyarchaeota archaeon]
MKKLHAAAFSIFLVCALLLVGSALNFALAYQTQPETQWFARPLYLAEPAAAYTAAGYSPNQIRAAYNLPSSGGEGTTIAIIVAYDAVTIREDLNVFCNEFDLPPLTEETFKIHKMSKRIETNSNWSKEAALDVEWAHAIAPQANILLVEARSPALSDLLLAIDHASEQPDVVSVSMSWGNDEFFHQTTYDSHLTNQYGTVFFAASGDDGAGVLWPASSVNAVAVGGTTLSLNADGSVSSEAAWSGSGGGISNYESKPEYQATYGLSGNKRSVPDVSYNANPHTGVAVYCDGNWYRMGGTSAGAPQWAAIHALGQSASNANLYQKAKSNASAFYFRDIYSGTNGAYSAVEGYDLVTGLGSPLTSNFEATTENNSVTLRPAAHSSPLNAENQFTVNYVYNGMQRTAYASDGTLTLTIDLGSDLTVSGASTGSLAQEKWVFNSDADAVTGSNLTLYYYDLVAQEASCTGADGDNPPNPPLTYTTAPSTPSGQQSPQTTTLSLNPNPQTVWALKGSEASVTNPLPVSSTERWFTPNSSVQIQGAGTLSFLYQQQCLLSITGTKQNTQWYNSGETAQVTVPAVSERTFGTGQRFASYSIDEGTAVQVQPTLGNVSILVTMDSPHTLELSSIKQYQIVLDDAAMSVLASVTPPTIRGDNYWYDQATPIVLTLNGVRNRSGGIGQRVSAFSLNGLSTAVSSADSVTVIDMPLFSAQTVSAILVNQYQLLTPSGSVNSVTLPAINGDAGWYDAQTAVTVAFDYTWNETPTSRLNAVGYTIGQDTTMDIQRAQNGTFLVQVTLTKPETIAVLSVTQYPVSFQFIDQNGNALTPSKFEIETDTVAIESPRNGLWLDGGAKFRINSVIWQNAEVKPAQQLSYETNAAVGEVVQCQVYDASISVKDFLGFPVSGAEVTVTLANQTVIQTVTSNDGVVTVTRIPVGTFNAKATYLGTSATATGNASQQPVTTMQVLLSFPTVLAILAVAFSVVTVVFIAVQKQKGSRKHRT